MSCQSEKDNLIDSKISSIDAQLELIELTEEEFDRYIEILEREGFDYTDEEIQFMSEHDFKFSQYNQLTKEREYWVLQQ